MGVIYVYYIHIILPLQKKHLQETENLKLKNAQLMALFAELDPEPLFRFNDKEEVILTNTSGQKLFPQKKILGEQISQLFPALNNFEYSACIAKGSTHTFYFKAKKSHYDVTIKGVPEMQFGQIYCNDITKRQFIEEELTESRKKLRELSNYLQRIQEEEKQKLMRELHDNLGQILSSIKYKFETFIASGNFSLEDKGILNELIAYLNLAYSEIKNLTYNLKPKILEDLGLIPALRDLCEQISHQSGIKGTFNSFGDDGNLNADLEINLFRLTQEALNNIVKHSEAKEFSVQLTIDEEYLRLIIEDDGIGFNPKQVEKEQINSKSMGLINMHERILAFNGELIIESSPKEGTEIMVEIPLVQTNEKDKSINS